MRFPEYNPPNLPQKEQKEETLSIAQEARDLAIKKLQKDLVENKTATPKIKKVRLEALIKLLENSEKDKHGELVTEEIMHYSEPPESAANESNLEEDRKLA